MTEDTLSLESFLPYRLNRLADAVSRDFSRLYRDRYGMTRPEWRLLATLGQYGTMTATAVGQHSSMHKTKVSRAVTALEKRRWLKREQDDGDRRVEHLSLTKGGVEAYRQIIPLALDFEEVLLAKMGARERKAMLAGLAALEQALGKQAEPED